MDTKAKSIIIGAVGLLIVAAVLVVFFYQGKLVSNQLADESGGNELSDLLTTESTPSSQDSSQVETTGDLKTYKGNGFSLQYPKTWGLLTCSNSQHFELDPASSQDLSGIVCDRAVKPVTVLVADRLNCSGEKINLGGKEVTKSTVASAGGDIDYRWCVSAGGKNFDISHRVSSSGARASSKDDFSSAVEQIISTLQAAQGS